jgi:hypothetical protein
MTAPQLALWSVTPKSVQPSVTEIKDAIRDEWLRLRLHVSPKKFLAVLKGREKECASQSWAEHEANHREYARKDREFVAHLEAHPEVYGASTPEMVQRFRALAADHDRQANRWAGLQEWLRANGLPAAVLGWDPTPGCLVAPEEMARIPDDVAAEDPLIRIAMQNAELPPVVTAWLQAKPLRKCQP